MDSNSIKKLAYSLVGDVCGIASIKRLENAPKGFHQLDTYSKVKSIVLLGKHFSTSLFDASTNVPYTLAKNKFAELLNNIYIQLTFNIESQC